MRAFVLQRAWHPCGQWIGLATGEISRLPWLHLVAVRCRPHRDWRAGSWEQVAVEQIGGTFGINAVSIAFQLRFGGSDWARHLRLSGCPSL